MKTKIILTLVVLLIVVAFNIIIPTYFVRDYGIQSSLATVNETDMSARVAFETSRQTNEWIYYASGSIGVFLLGMIWYKDVRNGIKLLKNL